MTDEERKNLAADLVADLRRKHYGNSRLRHEAADEIERLAKENDELRTPAVHDVQTLRDQVRLLWDAVIQLQNQVRQLETWIWQSPEQRALEQIALR
jgi:polyhydroxyalkanoate synthesis regulator phasin